MVCLDSFLAQGPQLEMLHISTQKLCSVIQPSCSGPELRHAWNANDVNPRVMRYKVPGSTETAEERKGVFHLVHGWIQQRQKEKVSPLVEIIPSPT